MEDDSHYDLHILPPNATPKEKAEPLVIENMAPNTNVGFLKRSIAKKASQGSAWHDLKLYFLGDELIDSNTLGQYMVKDKDEVIAVSSTIDVRRQLKPEMKEPSPVKKITSEDSEIETKSRHLENLFFKNTRTISMQQVDLGITVRELREKLVEKHSAFGDMKFYFIFGNKQLKDDQQLLMYPLSEVSSPYQYYDMAIDIVPRALQYS
ncbi:hypothetical protein BGZ60DRAFT_532961 [Tricladium varicosporioides]|nr:hypothetical protein BGZ60DRAFT_532961 [Hymenoscyphus varicosporioides]